MSFNLEDNSRHTEIDLLNQEIQQLEQQFKTEERPNVLNDLRLRLRFLKWKVELLTIAYGTKASEVTKRNKG
jgi:hypothetical protein